MGHILPLDLGNVKVVRNLIYYPSSRSKRAQNVDLEKAFPPFWGFSDSWIFEPRIIELSTLNPDIWTLGEKGIFEPQTFELCIFEPVSFEPCIFEPLVEDEFLNSAFLNP